MQKKIVDKFHQQLIEIIEITLKTRNLKETVAVCFPITVFKILYEGVCVCTSKQVPCTSRKLRFDYEVN